MEEKLNYTVRELKLKIDPVRRTIHLPKDAGTNNAMSTK
jgi:hypothetical protein